MANPIASVDNAVKSALSHRGRRQTRFADAANQLDPEIISLGNNGLIDVTDIAALLHSASPPLFAAGSPGWHREPSCRAQTPAQPQ